MLAEPFATPWMAVLDTARILLFLAGMTLCGAMAWAALDRERARGRGRRWGAAASGVALVVLCGSRLQTLGEPMAWQFVAALVAVALFAASVETYRREDGDR